MTSDRVWSAKALQSGSMFWSYDVLSTQLLITNTGMTTLERADSFTCQNLLFAENRLSLNSQGVGVVWGLGFKVKRSLYPTNNLKDS